MNPAPRVPASPTPALTAGLPLPRRVLRVTALGLAIGAALGLAGCSTPIKLDETPVESRNPVPPDKVDPAPVELPPATASAVPEPLVATTRILPQSQVATVDLAPRGGVAGGAAGGALAAGGAAGAGAGDAAARNGAMPVPGKDRVVYFDFDSFVVKDDFLPMIEVHARALNANKQRRLLIEGHTDERGGREYNLALGQKRAEAVLRSMGVLGVADGQLEAVSYGKERPAAEGHDEQAWAQNRRAELKDR